MITAKGKVLKIDTIPTKKDKNRSFQRVRILGPQGEVHNFMYFPPADKDGKQELLTVPQGQDIEIILQESTQGVIESYQHTGKK